MLKSACSALLAILTGLAPGCASTSSPPPAAKPAPVVLMVKKANPRRDSAEAPEVDGDLDLAIPEGVSKDLPLSGTKWEWEGNLIPERYEGLNHAGVYSLEFKTNGWFEFQADCRRGAGIYEARGGHIALAVIKASHSTCLRGSRADDFMKALEEARSFTVAENRLYFGAKRGEKTIVFTRK